MACDSLFPAVSRRLSDITFNITLWWNFHHRFFLFYPKIIWIEATNVQKNVKPHIVLIDGVKYYSDRPETCRSCFFWKNRKGPCILGQENCYYLAEIIQSEQQKKCEGCCYASGRSCVSATCYKDLMAQFNASQNTEPKEGAAND